MKIGKLPNDVLNDIVINSIHNKRSEILTRPEIGEDCAAFNIDNDTCVMSTDPITGAVNNIGKIAVNVALNDIASSGAIPFGIMLNILIPPNGTIDQLKTIMSDINDTCDLLNVDILGGHTEVTDAVTRYVIVSTAVGRVKNNKLIKTSDAKSGDCVLITKNVGLEGTSIIVNEKREFLKGKLPKEEIKECDNLINNLGVIKEGLICSKLKVHSMHDITEGGILGAIWEVCHSSNLGAYIYKDKIPVSKVTKKICKLFNIDYLKLISSGSMLITCDKSIKDRVILELEKSGIKCSEIGILTISKDIIINVNGKDEIIKQPESDELYKVI